MPILKRPESLQKITLPPRQGIIANKTDVLVVGGGPAGIGAALGAAWAGADVILVERHGFLGGNATAALVMPLMSYHTDKYHLLKPEQAVEINRNLTPTDHGPGDPTTAGALEELLTRLVSAGGAIPPSPETGYVVPFDPEIFKFVAMDLLSEAGVKLLFHAFASDVLNPPKPTGVVFETKSGPIVIEARAIVDCTGDGDIAFRAGAPFEIGREKDHSVQPMTMMFRMGEFSKIAFNNYVSKHPDQWKKGVFGLWDLIKHATETGELELTRDNILFFGTPHEHEVSVNSTRIHQVLGTDVWDLSYAEMEGRRQIQQITAFFKKYVPGFEHSYLIQSGVTVGVRESRRIGGEYQLTANDILSARKFPDGIALGSYPIDIHDPKGKGTVLKRLPPGEAYGIPLRSLIPKETENILVAGRCISGTHEAHSSYRVMPTSMATGQAAGVCAAISLREKKSFRDCDVKKIQQELKSQKAIL